jgi:mRNA interferase RelE/StbE
MAEVKFTDPAKEQLSDLEKEVRIRIYDKLEEIKDWPDHFLVRLKGYPYYRLRIGDYRVIIQWEKDREQLWVVAVGHRKNIYDKDW